MRGPVLRPALVVTLMALAGCATMTRTEVGPYKFIAGPMGPVALRWEIAKAAVAGWEVVGVAGDDKLRLVTLHKP